MIFDTSPTTPPTTRSESKTPYWLRTLSRGLLIAVAIAALFMAAPMLQGLFYTAFPPGPVPADQLPAWRDSYETALAESAATGKPVLIDFTATWCPPCKVMEARTWPDEGVRSAIAQRVIPLKLDIDQPASAAASQRYGVRTIPTILLVDADGDELARGGFMSAGDMTDFIQTHAPANAADATDF